MPAKSSVFLWLSKDKGFSDQYARAMESRTEVLAEEILEIADESAADFTETEDGKTVFNGEAVQRSKLRVDTRKWLMSKMAPKKYGDKITQELTGKDGKPLNTAPTIIFTGCPPNTPAPEAVDSTSDGSE